MADGAWAGLAWVVAHPVVSHSFVALGWMSLAGAVLAAARVRGAAWHAAGYASMFSFAREFDQAEHFFRPGSGHLQAFLLALWPGNWIGGGARPAEWLVPMGVVLAVALVRSRGARPGRDLALGRPADLVQPDLRSPAAIEP